MFYDFWFWFLNLGSGTHDGSPDMKTGCLEKFFIKLKWFFNNVQLSFRDEKLLPIAFGRRRNLVKATLPYWPAVVIDRLTRVAWYLPPIRNLSLLYALRTMSDWYAIVNMQFLGKSPKIGIGIFWSNMGPMKGWEPLFHCVKLMSAVFLIHRIICAGVVLDMD